MLYSSLSEVAPSAVLYFELLRVGNVYYGLGRVPQFSRALTYHLFVLSEVT